MNFKIFFSTILLMFLSELGDKTQLAALTLSAKEKSPFTILIAAIIGFSLSTLLAVIIGSFGAKFLPTTIIQKASALAFIVIGVLMLFNKL